MIHYVTQNAMQQLFGKEC